MNEITIKKIHKNAIKTISEKEIKDKAIELFSVFSQAMNEQEDTYCNNFEYLTKRHKTAWMKVAEHELKNIKPNQV